MAARPLWKGHLRLSLVTVPVRVYPATNAAATVSFHQLHSKCNTRIQYKKWCPHCEREVNNDEIVKGFEFERGRYVALTAKEIASVRPERRERTAPFPGQLARGASRLFADGSHPEARLCPGTAAQRC